MFSARLQRGLGDVENVQVGEAPVQQGIDQNRCPSPHIDHPGLSRNAQEVHQFEGHDRLCLVPTDAVGSVALVD